MMTFKHIKLLALCTYSLMFAHQGACKNQTSSLNPVNIAFKQLAAHDPSFADNLERECHDFLKRARTLSQNPSIFSKLFEFSKFPVLSTAAMGTIGTVVPLLLALWQKNKLRGLNLGIKLTDCIAPFIKVTLPISLASGLIGGSLLGSVSKASSSSLHQIYHTDLATAEIITLVTMFITTLCAFPLGTKIGDALVGKSFHMVEAMLHAIEARAYSIIATSVILIVTYTLGFTYLTHKAAQKTHTLSDQENKLLFALATKLLDASTSKEAKNALQQLMVSLQNPAVTTT